MQAAPIVSKWHSFRPSPDAGAIVVDDLLFRFLVDLEVQKAQRLRYCVSLACLSVEVASAQTREPPRPSLTETIAHDIRGSDVVAQWAPAPVALLLIGAETTHVPSILRRLMALLDTTTCSAGGSCYPKTAASAQDMLRQAVDSMIEAKQDGGNRLYVAS